MRTQRLKAAAAAVAAAALLAACSPKPAEQQGAQPSKTDSSAVLAEVNGKSITAEDFKEEAASINPLAVRALEDEKNREKFLDNLVDKELIIQKAVSMGLDKDPEVVKKVERVKGTLVLGTFVKKEVLDKANVTDQDVKAYFDQHKDELGAVRLSHILVATQAEAEKVIERLKAGEDFKKLARASSLDTKTKNSGGDLGYIKWSQFGSSSLKDAAFKLKAGEVSGIVQSQFGYHIMKVTDKKPAAGSEFEAMKENLKAQVSEKKKEEIFDAIVKDLRAKAKIATKPENLKSVDLSAQAALPGMPGGEPQK